MEAYSKILDCEVICCILHYDYDVCVSKYSNVCVLSLKVNIGRLDESFNKFSDIRYAC